MQTESSTLNLVQQMDSFALAISRLSFVVAAISVFLAFRSLRVAQASNRAAIFERGYEVYGDAERFLGAWMRDGNPDLSLLHVLVGAWSRSHFLFDPAVTKYLRKLWLDAVAADYAAKVMAGEVEGDRQEAIEKNHKLLVRHADFDKLRGQFLPHLKV